MRVQGLLSISDCKAERGGFHCVKSFRGERFFQWARDNEEYGKREDIVGRNFVEVPDDDPMRSETIQVPMRAGSLLIWDSQLPHGCVRSSPSAIQSVLMTALANNLFVLFRGFLLGPNSNFPNTSDQFRIVQYVKMIPANDPREFRPALQLSKYMLEQWFGRGYEPSELGRKLLGLDEWEPEPDVHIVNSCEEIGEQQEDEEEGSKQAS